MGIAYEVQPVSRPVRGSIRPPGSKSLTNRALITAALADGTSRLTGVLDSEDTRVMVESLGRLGIAVDHDAQSCTMQVTGCAGKPAADEADLWLENSGTSIRFLTALCALGDGRFRLDGSSRMRERPIGDLVDALKSLGAGVACETDSNCPPVVVEGSGLAGGKTTVDGSLSSQFLSALLMASPCAARPVDIHVSGQLVSQPYVDMTLGVMAQFGVTAGCPETNLFRIPPQQYQCADYDIEPDASAASYFFAAAAVTGGEVTVQGLSTEALQGDIGFVDALEQMGCHVDYGDESITLQGSELSGIDIDMNTISDTAQTLAVVAVFAGGSTRIRNVAHNRHKETDRITAVVTELRRLGIEVDQHEDGMTIHSGEPQAATIETYNDHRMAMSFALAGLRIPGVRIVNPACTGKTYPGFWTDLETICGGAA